MKLTGLTCAFVLISCTSGATAVQADSVKGAIEAANSNVLSGCG